MFANFEMNLSWSELIKRTAAKTISDDVQGLAAQLAYYFVFALLPALLSLVAIASFFPLRHVTLDITRSLTPFVPEEVIEIIQQQMSTIAEGQHGGLLTMGLLGSLWSSASAMVSIISATNKAYDITDSRPWWKVRLTPIALTVALSFLIVIAFTLIVFGVQLADALASHFGLGAVFVGIWKVIQWPVAFALVVAGIGLTYYFALDAEQDWVWVTPGSFVLLLWFYLTGLAIVIGPERNAEIERESPWAKASRGKVAGGRRKIGAAGPDTSRKDGDVATASEAGFASQGELGTA